MKIAIVNKFFFLKGGQETVALEQMKLLEQAGHEVAFFSMHHPKNRKDYHWSKYFVDYADFSLQDPKLSLSQKQTLGVRFIANFPAAYRFKAFLEDFKPDIIHCHGIAHQLTYTILPVAKKYGIPVVQTLHDYQIICPSYTLLRGGVSICDSGCKSVNYMPCIQNRCVKNSLPASILSALEMTFNRNFFDYSKHIEKFISPSQFLADKVVRSGISAHKVMKLSNFLVNIDSIEPNYTNSGYFAYVGRLSHEKGLLTLLAAFEKTPEAKLIIAGNGPLNSTLTNYCQENKIKNIEMLGHLETRKLKALVANAIAVIIPSEWYENQPMTIIEAFAQGKPVIAANIGGIPEMVIHAENGFLFPPGDAQSLASIISEVPKHTELLIKLGASARAYAREAYNPKSHCKALIDLYTTLL